MQLGQTYNTCTVKYDACVYCGSVKHKREECIMRCCYFCKENGRHMFGKCVQYQKKRDDIKELEKRLVKCELCGIFGHTLDRCFIVPSTAATYQNEEVACIRCTKNSCDGTCDTHTKWQFFDWGEVEEDELRLEKELMRGKPNDIVFKNRKPEVRKERFKNED